MQISLNVATTRIFIFIFSLLVQHIEILGLFYRASPTPAVEVYIERVCETSGFW